MSESQPYGDFPLLETAEYVARLNARAQAAQALLGEWIDRAQAAEAALRALAEPIAASPCACGLSVNFTCLPCRARAALSAPAEERSDVCGAGGITSFCPSEQLDGTAEEGKPPNDRGPLVRDWHGRGPAAADDLLKLCDEYEQVRDEEGEFANAASEFAAFRIAEHFALIRRAVLAAPSGASE